MGYRFVKSDGDDTADGLTHATAWKTIAKVNAASLAAGDVVKFYGGSTFIGTILATHSGSAGNPIRYTSYGKYGKAKIQPVTGNGFTGTNVAYVEADGLELAGNESGTPNGNSDPDTFRPAGAEFYNSHTDTTTYSGCKVKNCDVHGFITGIWGYAEGSSTSGFTGLQITNNYVHDCTAFGIQTWSAAGTITRKFIDPIINDNFVEHIPGYSARVSGVGIAIGFAYGLNSHLDTATAQCNRNVVRDCGYAATNTVGGGPGAIIPVYSEGVQVRRNEVYRIYANAIGEDGVGVDIDEKCLVCTGFENHIHECDGAGAYMFNADFGNVLFNNVIWNCARVQATGQGAISASGVCHQNNWFIGNIVIHMEGSDTPAANEIGAPLHTIGFAHNILVSNAPTAPIANYVDDSTEDVMWQNNYYSTNGLRIKRSGVTYTSLAAFRATYKERLANLTDTGFTVKPEWFDSLPANPPTFNDSNAMRFGLQALFSLPASSDLFDSALDISASTPSTPTTDMAGVTLALPYALGAFGYASGAALGNADVGAIANQMLARGFVVQANNRDGDRVPASDRLELGSLVVRADNRDGEEVATDASISDVQTDLNNLTTSTGAIGSILSGIETGATVIRADTRDGDEIATSSAVDAHMNIAISPALVNTSQPRYSSMQIANIAKGSAPVDVWTVLDPRTREALDLSSFDLRLVVASVSSLGDEDADPIDDTLASSWKYEEASSGGLSVGGDGNNQLTINWDANDTDTVGHYRAFLWDITSKTCICKADFDIEPSVFDVE